MTKQDERTLSIRIGGLAKRTGCSIETIRYYERVSILPAPPRTASGQRVYDAGHLRRLNFVRRCRDLGFSLSDVRVLLHLSDREGSACADVRRLTLDHAKTIRRRIADLRRMERVLSGMAERCGGVADCPIIDTLSSNDRIQESR
ncbi:MAG: MerR family DNA-binding protein [Alphaproteobacteria bacterium]|nr:MerR family DNA-binding protein [Alphaproteobacteria bacterium]